MPLSRIALKENAIPIEFPGIEHGKINELSSDNLDSNIEANDANNDINGSFENWIKSFKDKINLENYFLFQTEEKLILYSSWRGQYIRNPCIIQK